MTSERLRRMLLVALPILLTLAVVAPIRSYDFFWHLATGRWIVEHRALPATDPFAVASARVDWINGEWLFELPQYLLYSIGGLSALAWVRALLVAAMFTIAFAIASRRASIGTALLLTTIALAGGHERLDARPSTVAALLAAIAVVVLTRTDVRAAIAYVVLTVIWINTHPSALLAPMLAAGALLRRERPPMWLPLASAVALLINPHGPAAVMAPMRLTLSLRSGSFVNAEWLPSAPRLFPLLYVTVIVALVLFFAARRESGTLWRFVLWAGFAYLAVAHVRNQGLYFATLPLLVPLPTRPALDRWLIPFSAIPVIWIALSVTHDTGLEPRRFPVTAAARLRESGLQGNIFNADQFGGYLIWQFYPQRRVLTDGRNELYHLYLQESAAANGDSRAWDALVQKYRVAIAVDEYRPPLVVTDAVTRQRTLLPASRAYYPTQRWALIAYDEVAMVYARRELFSADELKRWEIKGVVPDAR